MPAPTPAARKRRRDKAGRRSYFGRLADSGHFVRLQAELPLRVGETEGDRPFGVADAVRAVHRLHREAAEIETGEVERVETGLRHDDLQFIARGDGYKRARFRADADPVDAVRRRD